MAPETNETPTPTQRRRRGWALLATSMGFGVVQLDVSVVNVAIKPIGAQLGGHIDGLQWVVNAYTVAFAALILTAGTLGDRLGAKRVFISGITLFTAASAACGLAPTLTVLDAARAVQGVGAAALVPCSLALLHHAYPDAANRARAVGLWAAGASVALSAGPLVGGLLTASLGWRSIFFINIPLGYACIALTLRYAAETPHRAGHGVDLRGQALAVLSLLALAWATITAGQHGFTPAVCDGFATAAGAIVAFVWAESTANDPMLPLRFFRSSTFSATTTIGLVVNVAFYGLVFVLSLYFQSAERYSALNTGLAFAPMTAAVLAGNLLAGRVAQRIAARRTILTGAVTMAVGLVGLLPAGVGTGYPHLVAQFIAVGFGLGLVVPAMTTELLGSVDKAWSGLASGTLNTARQTGSVIGVAVFGAFASANLVIGLRYDLIVAVGAALAAAALTSVMAGPPRSRSGPRGLC